MPSTTFSPRAYFEKLVHQWWVVFLAIAIGGSSGAGLSLLTPPRYEAEAKISTSIDYTLLPELEDYEEDRIINEAGWVMLSDAVLLDVQERAKTEGVRIVFEDFDTRFSADRIDDLWALRVAGTDQQEASTLANIWVDISYQHLSDAHAYALEASTIRSAIAALESCQQADDGTAPALRLQLHYKQLCGYSLVSQLRGERGDGIAWDGAGIDGWPDRFVVQREKGIKR